MNLIKYEKDCFRLNSRDLSVTKVFCELTDGYGNFYTNRKGSYPPSAIAVSGELFETELLAKNEIDSRTRKMREFIRNRIAILEGVANSENFSDLVLLYDYIAGDWIAREYGTFGLLAKYFPKPPPPHT
jgi:hypothetical protein